jgi:hypothetical protein
LVQATVDQVVTRDRKPATFPIEAASRLSFWAEKTRRLPGGFDMDTAVRGTHPSAADLDYQQVVYVELPLQPSGMGGQPLFRALEHPFGTFRHLTSFA